MKKALLITVCVSAMMVVNGALARDSDCNKTGDDYHSSNGWDCKYNTSGNLIEEYYQDPDWSAEQYRKQYDDNGRPVLEMHFTDNADEEMEVIKYNYDGAQLISKETITKYYLEAPRYTDLSYEDFENEPKTETKYKYNDAGKLIEETIDGYATAVYNYDENGNLKTKAEKSNIYSDTFILTNYDSQGNIISRNSYYALFEWIEEEQGPCPCPTGACGRLYNGNNGQWETYHRQSIGNGQYAICVGEEVCKSYYLEDEDGNYSECSSFTKLLLGITIEDEQKALKKTKEIYNEKDGSYTIYDKDGNFLGFKGKRIYTIDEANAVAGKTNTFSIRYR